MMPDVRRQQIVSLVRERSAISIEELKAILGVSGPTLRRDLSRLASQRLVRRIRGGAAAIEGLERAQDWSSRRDKELKVRIARQAAKLVKPKMTVSLENGGTVFEVARCLLKIPEIRVITNSLHVANLLNLYGKCREVKLTGGMLRRDSYLYGPFTSLVLAHETVDIAFIGTMAFSVEHGITDPDPAAAEIKRTFTQYARQVVLVADHKKAGRVEPVPVEPLNVVDTLVTTEEIDSDTLRQIQDLGIQVLTC